MANSIETHVLEELRKLESIVTAVECFGRCSVEVQPQDLHSFGYVCSFLGELLQERFQEFHIVVAQQLLPFVKGIQTERLQ